MGIKGLRGADLAHCLYLEANCIEHKSKNPCFRCGAQLVSITLKLSIKGFTLVLPRCNSDFYVLHVRQAMKTLSYGYTHEAMTPSYGIWLLFILLENNMFYMYPIHYDQLHQMFLFLTLKRPQTWQQFRTPARKNPAAENQESLV